MRGKEKKSLLELYNSVEFKMTFGFTCEVTSFILTGYYLAFQAYIVTGIFAILSLFLAMYTGNRIKEISILEYKEELKK